MAEAVRTIVSVYRQSTYIGEDRIALPETGITLIWADRIRAKRERERESIGVCSMMEMSNAIYVPAAAPPQPDAHSAFPSLAPCNQNHNSSEIACYWAEATSSSRNERPAPAGSIGRGFATDPTASGRSNERRDGSGRAQV